MTQLSLIVLNLWIGCKSFVEGKKLVSLGEFAYVDFFNGFLSQNQGQNSGSGGGGEDGQEKDRLFYSPAFR